MPIISNNKSFNLEWFPKTVLRKAYYKPICKLNNGHKADAKAKTTETSQVSDEVEPGHSFGSLKLLGKG